MSGPVALRIGSRHRTVIGAQNPLMQSCDGSHSPRPWRTSRPSPRTAAARHHGNVSSAASSLQIPAGADRGLAPREVPPAPRASEEVAGRTAERRAVAASVRGSGVEVRECGSGRSGTRTHGPHPLKVGGRTGRAQPGELGGAGSSSAAPPRAGSWLRALVTTVLLRVCSTPLSLCPWMLVSVPVPAIEPAAQLPVHTDAEPAVGASVRASTPKSWRPPIVKASLWLPTKAPTKEDAGGEVYRVGCACREHSERGDWGERPAWWRRTERSWWSSSR